MRATAVLLRRRRPIRMAHVAGWVTAIAAVNGLLRAQAVPDRAPFAWWLHGLLCVMTLALPLMVWSPGQVTSRFVETLLLTRVSAGEWIDLLVCSAVRRVGGVLTVAFLGGLVIQAAAAPEDIVRIVLWPLMVCCLIATTVLCAHLRPVWELRQLATLSALLLSCALLVGSFFFSDTAWLAALLSTSLVLLCGVRANLQRQLDVRQSVPATHRHQVMRSRPFNRNPIVAREVWRAAGTGRVTVFMRRYGLVLASVLGLAFVAASISTPTDVLLVFVLLVLWVLASAICTYCTTVSAVLTEERCQATSLLMVSPLRAGEFVRGWIIWAMRARWVEAIALWIGSAMVVGNVEASWSDGTWWWCLSWNTMAIGTGLLASAAAARVGLSVSQGGHRGWSRYWVWAVWLCGALGLTVVIVAAAVSYCPDPLAIVLFFCAPVLVSLGALGVANCQLQRAFGRNGEALSLGPQ